MTYPTNYFPEASKRQQKRGIITEVETNWGVYTIKARNDKVWIEAYGHGGKKRQMPLVSTVEEAKEIIWQWAKPSPQEDIISF